MSQEEKYPRLSKLLRENPGWTLDQALIWTENELKRLEAKEKN